MASRYDPRRDPDAVRKGLLSMYSIDTILDVGANIGQYGQRIRQLGYEGKIVSFEPLSSAFELLKTRAASDGNWIAKQCALGGSDGPASINIAGNSFSSSLLGMLPRHVQVAPQSAYVGKEEITVHQLDTLYDECVSSNANVFLKIDTQGFTSKVLAGARRSLGKIRGLEVELSTIPLYADEPLIHDVLTVLFDQGFLVYYLEPEILDQNSGQQLQLNGLFHRPKSI
ncbi:MAG: FkbM family methyltransferase [Steroidobacteraceae bacterium]